MGNAVRNFIDGADAWLRWHEEHMTKQQKDDAVCLFIGMSLVAVMLVGILLGW